MLFHASSDHVINNSHPKEDESMEWMAQILDELRYRPNVVTEKALYSVIACVPGL